MDDQEGIELIHELALSAAQQAMDQLGHDIHVDTLSIDIFDEGERYVYEFSAPRPEGSAADVKDSVGSDEHPDDDGELYFTITVTLATREVALKILNLPGVERGESDFVVDPLQATADMLVFSMRLTGEEADEVPDALPLREHLDRARLDYSLESLRVVDDYLLKVHSTLDIEKQFPVLECIVMRTGAYMGEAMRRNSGDIPLNWVGYENLHDLIGSAAFEKHVGEAFIFNRTVLAAGNRLLFPLKAVMRRAVDGEAAENIYQVALDEVTSMQGKKLNNWLDGAMSWFGLGK
jgi:hypothetical protein